MSYAVVRSYGETERERERDGVCVVTQDGGIMPNFSQIDIRISDTRITDITLSSTLTRPTATPWGNAEGRR